MVGMERDMEDIDRKPVVGLLEGEWKALKTEQ